MTGSTFKANADIKPERIKTYELVVEQYLGITFAPSAAYINTTFSGLIGQTTDPTDGKLFYSNVDNITARGVELAMEGNGPQAGGRLSYARSSAPKTTISNNS